MPKKLFVLASIVLVLQAPAVLSRPPQNPSGQMMQDEVTTLKAQVQRLEKEATDDKSKAEDLTLARARLATAEGKPKAACAAWRKIIASREERMKRWELLVAKGVICSPDDPVIIRGPVAEARCGLAEVEKDREVLAKELPKVIAYHEAQLAVVRRLAKAGAYPPEEAEKDEKALLKELREAQQRLDAVKR